MNILLIRPSRIKQAVTLGEIMFSEPIGLEIISAMLKDRHKVEILDMMAEQIDLETELKRFKPEVVGLTSLCIDVQAVLALAERVKKFNPGIVILAGGTQTYLDKEGFFDPSIDYVVERTTKTNVKDLIAHLENKGSIPAIEGIFSRTNGYEGMKGAGCNVYMHPDRSATKRYRQSYSYFGYKPCAIMGTSQGCSKKCNFCLRWRIEGPAEIYFPMDFIKEELLSIEEEAVMIFDNDFLHNGERIEAFCDMLETEGILKTFICYGCVESLLKNKTSVRRFVDLGLKAVLVGYETFSEKELEDYGKNSKIDEVFEAASFTKEIGLDVWASFIFHPDWDKNDFKAFRRFLKKADPEISTFSPLTPFPGLPMHTQYKERLVASKREYEKWSFGEVTIAPSRLSLRRYYYEIMKTHFYINLVRNKAGYLIGKFGYRTLARLLWGSVKAAFKYAGLMARA